MLAGWVVSGRRSNRLLARGPKAPGPLRAFSLRVRAPRGEQIAAVATARKLAVVVWHLLTKAEDYTWTRPLVVWRCFQCAFGKSSKATSRSQSLIEGLTDGRHALLCAPRLERPLLALGVLPRLGGGDRGKRPSALGVQRLGRLVEQVQDPVVPAALRPGLWEHGGQRAPGEHLPPRFGAALE